MRFVSNPESMKLFETHSQILGFEHLSSNI